MDDTVRAKNEFTTALAMARVQLGADCPAKEYYRNMARGLSHLANALEIIHAKVEKLERAHQPVNTRPAQMTTAGLIR